MPTIIVASGPQMGDCYPLGRRTTVFGRGEALLVQIRDELVSRKHLQIRYEASEGRYYALDMRSTHGVFINGNQINRETLLNDKDRIQIGDTILIFTDEDISDPEIALSRVKKGGEHKISTKLFSKFKSRLHKG